MKVAKRTLSLLLMILSGFVKLSAAQYEGYVGSEIQIPMPSTSFGTVTTTVWHNPDTECLSVNGSTYGGATVTIDKYFTRTVYVTCTVYYETESPGYTYHGHDVATFSIDCKPTKITGLPSSLKMNVGDTEGLDWSWSPNYATKPTLTWTTSNSSVVSINYYNELVAEGAGTATVTVKNNCGDDVKISVTVNEIPVTSASIATFYSVYADKSKTLSVSVTPSNATVKNKVWTSADPSIASINQYTGELTGVWPGKTKVWCVVNGTKKTNEAEVTVMEPSFKFQEFSLAEGATGVETKPTLTAEFSHNLSQSDNYDDIALTDANGQLVSGTLTISGTKLMFTPTKHLQPMANYTWTIPAKAVKNKWGTNYMTAKRLNFTTADWQRMTLSIQPETRFLNIGDEITLSCSVPDATIYYSTDGNEPTEIYTIPLSFEKSMTLRAIARLDGYYDTDELTYECLKSVEIVEKFPDTEPLYRYTDVNPNITYSYPIKQGDNFCEITMKDVHGELVDCEFIIQGQTLFLVPSEPLQTGRVYDVILPGDALITDKGEPCAAYEWLFSTGYYATAVSIGGPELTTAIKTDGSLWTWGKRLTEANAEDGSYSYTVQENPGSFIDSDVVAVSSGYMHHAIIKRDGSLWMWGRQLCGEFGNGSTEASAQPVKVMSSGVKSVSCGLQTTAVVKQDGTLWMCGRNDLGQIDDTRTVCNSFKKVSDDVREVTLSWGSIQIVKADGTVETRTWDEKADDNRKPAEPNNNVANEYATIEYGWKNAVALKENGSVWTWDNASADDTPTQMIEGRISSQLEGLTAVHPTITIAKGGKGVLTALPVPLNADYTTLTWTDSGNGVATVSNRGVVTGLMDGTTTITAEIASEDGQRFSQHFRVIVGENGVLMGDANGDGYVTIADVTAIINKINKVQTGTFVEAAADVNGDGVISIADVTGVINIINQ